MAVAIILRAAMYPPGYVAMAMDNRRLYFWMEGIGCNLLTLLLTGGGFLLWGINGIGYAMIADNFLCLLLYIFVNRRLFGMRVDRGAWKCMCVATVAGCTTLAASYIPHPVLSYIVMSAVTLVTCVTSFFALKKRLRKRNA